MPSATLSLGRVSSSAPDCVSVQSESSFSALPCLSPWGFVSLPPEQSQAAVLSCGLHDFYLGSPQSAPSLLAGEVMLCSAGGAQICLKQNGDVVINGQVFPRASQEDA